MEIQLKIPKKAVTCKIVALYLQQRKTNKIQMDVGDNLNRTQTAPSHCEQ